MMRWCEMTLGSDANLDYLPRLQRLRVLWPRDFDIVCCVFVVYGDLVASSHSAFESGLVPPLCSLWSCSYVLSYTNEAGTTTHVNLLILGASIVEQ